MVSDFPNYIDIMKKIYGIVIYYVKEHVSNTRVCTAR